MDNFQSWTKVTSDLPWGVQAVFKDTLQAVADDQIKLTYSADYSNGSPCLVNAAATMLGSIAGKGGTGVPSNAFPELVRAFDAINRTLHEEGVNDDDHTVSPLAAEILIRNFGAMKDQPIADMVDEATKGEAYAQHQYREPSDSDLTRDWLNALEKDAVCDLSTILHNEEVPNGENIESHS